MISTAGPELLRPREDLRRVGERFAGVWHYQCQGLSPACGARGLIRSRGHRNNRPEALITRASQAKITLSLVSFTVVLRNVTQCFMMSPPPPPPLFSWGKCRVKTNERLQTRQLLPYQF